MQTQPWIFGRKGNTKYRAEAGRAGDTDVSGVLLHNAVGHGEPQAGTATDTFRSKEGVVDLGDVVRRNANAGVGNFNHQRTIVAISGRQRNTAVAVSD